MPLSLNKLGVAETGELLIVKKTLQLIKVFNNSCLAEADTKQI